MAGHLGPAALHQRPDAVPGRAAAAPGAQPDRRLRARRSRSPGGWAGRRVVLHVGAAESVLIVDAQRRARSGISKDSHLAAEFDLTDRLRPGENTLRADRREVVRRDVRRGPGPVVARRASPARCSCTRPNRVHLADIRAIAGLARRPGHGHARADRRRRRSPGAEPEPGWTVEAASRAWSAPLAADGAHPRARTGGALLHRSARPGSRAASRPARPLERRGAGRDVAGAPSPARAACPRGEVTLAAATSPACEPGRRRRRTSTRSRSCCAVAGRAIGRGGRPPDRLPTGRDPSASTC